MFGSRAVPTKFDAAPAGGVELPAAVCSWDCCLGLTPCSGAAQVRCRGGPR